MAARPHSRHGDVADDCVADACAVRGAPVLAYIGDGDKGGGNGVDGNGFNGNGVNGYGNNV